MRFIGDENRISKGSELMEVIARFKNEISGSVTEIPMGYEKENDLMGLNKRLAAYDKLANLMGEYYVGECILLNEWDVEEDKADGIWSK